MATLLATLLLLSCREGGEAPAPQVTCESVAAVLRAPAQQRKVVEALGAGNYESCRSSILSSGEPLISDPGRGLCLAASRGDKAFVTYLLGHGVKADARPDVNDFTPLMCAAMDNRTEVVRLLLAHGADPSARWTEQAADGAVRVYSVEEVARKYGASEDTLQLLAAPGR